MSSLPSVRNMDTLPSPHRSRITLVRVKCTFCRKAKKKCIPVERRWPVQKCARCIEKCLPCSEGTKPQRPKIVAAVSSSNSQPRVPLPLLAPQLDSCNRGDGHRAPLVLPSEVSEVYKEKKNGIVDPGWIDDSAIPTEAQYQRDVKINVKECLLLLSIQTVVTMSLQELKLQANNMAAIFHNDPYINSPEAMLPGLKEVFLDYKRFATLLRRMILHVGAGKILCHAYDALQVDYSHPDISWSLEPHSQHIAEDVNTFQRMGYDEFAHILLMKKLPRQAYISDADAQQFVHCRERFLLGIRPLLESRDLKNHVPERIRNSQMFIPGSLLKLSRVAEHVRRIGLPDCLGRSVNHMLADAGQAVAWSQEDSKEADILGRSRLYFACVAGDTAEVHAARHAKADLKHSALHGLEPLHISASLGHVSTCKTLWNDHVCRVQPLSSRDRLGRTPLMWAAFVGHESAVDFFHGVAGKDEADPDSFGCSAMTLAVCGGHAHIVKYLLQLGVPVDKPDVRGRTPFWYAARYCNYKALRYLADAGADVDRPDIYGRTPLGEAAKQGHSAALEYLLSLNTFDVVTHLAISTPVNVAAKDSQGKTALILATESGNPVCVSLITGHNPSDLDALYAQGLVAARNIAIELKNPNVLLALGAEQKVFSKNLPGVDWKGKYMKPLIVSQNQGTMLTDTFPRL